MPALGCGGALLLSWGMRNRPYGEGQVPPRWATLQGRAGTALEERALVLGMELLENTNILHISVLLSST